MSHREGGRTTPGGAPSGATSAVLTIGALVSAACLMGAVVLGLLGRPATAGDPLDIGSVIGAFVDLRPWGWAAIGVLVVIATPAVGLVATAVEYGGRRESLLALGVLAILGVSLGIALLR